MSVTFFWSLQIITALEEDSTAQKMQLGYRLQQIAAAVENKVTDLWPVTSDRRCKRDKASDRKRPETLPEGMNSYFLKTSEHRGEQRIFKMDGYD